MTKFLIALTATTIAAMFFWALLGFVFLDWNPLNWNWVGRFALVILTVFFTIRGLMQQDTDY